MSDHLPNVSEWELIDLWRYRQEWKEQEEHAKKRRKKADDEIIRRAAELDAQLLDIGCDEPITIVYSTDYEYDTNVVDSELWPLVERAGIQEEYRQNVTHRYKIRKPWLNRLLKRGAEWKDVVERITVAMRGAPRVAGGPELKALGEYTERPEGIVDDE